LEGFSAGNPNCRTGRADHTAWSWFYLWCVAELVADELDVGAVFIEHFLGSGEFFFHGVKFEFDERVPAVGVAGSGGVDGVWKQRGLYFGEAIKCRSQEEFFCFVVKYGLADGGSEVGFRVVPGLEFVGSMILHLVGRIDLQRQGCQGEALLKLLSY
jgi:hypothetical protein